MRVLVSGAGIAGLTVAYWLTSYGHEVEVVERSADISAHQGYMVTFWGAGYEVARRMGILPELQQLDHSVASLNVYQGGQQAVSLSMEDLRRLFHHEFSILPRGDLHKVIYRKVKNQILLTLGKEIVQMENNPASVSVEYSDGSTRSYDLLIGADGVHSAVRKLIFGNEDLYTKNLGYEFRMISRSNPHADTQNFYMDAFPGGFFAKYGVSKDAEIQFYISKAGMTLDAINRLCPKQPYLVEEIKSIVSENSDKIIDRYADKLIQIRMDKWYKGRVLLVGDACQCLSLTAGQGCSMAMAAAYVFAFILNKNQANYLQAFEEYQNWVKPQIDLKQQRAVKFMRNLIPDTWLGLAVRNLALKSFNVPFVAPALLRGAHAQEMLLPQY